jgi:hypothetical protein
MACNHFPKQDYVSNTNHTHWGKEGRTPVIFLHFSEQEVGREEIVVHQMKLLDGLEISWLMTSASYPRKLPGTDDT